MPTLISEEQIYAEAQQRVKARKDFYGHLSAWAIVNSILIIIWFIYSFGDTPWFLWPLGIWGAFILYKYIRVFVIKDKLDRNAIEKEAEKIKKEIG
jgi:hypothetical protein